MYRRTDLVSLDAMLRSLLLVLLVAALPASEAGRTADFPQRVGNLLDALATNPLPQLYYQPAMFTPPLWAMIKLRGAAAEIITRSEDHALPLFRFNVVTALIHRLKLGGYTDERPLIAGFLARCLVDQDPWLRTEAVWGLGMYGDSSHLPAIRPLLQDAFKRCAAEAQTAVRLIERRAADTR